MHHRSQICLCHFLLSLVSMPDLATRMYHSPHDDVFYQPYFKTNTSFPVAGGNCLEYIFPCVRVSGHHCSVILECNVYNCIYSCNMAMMYSKLTCTVETWPAMCVNGIRVLKYNIFFALGGSFEVTIFNQYSQYERPKPFQNKLSLETLFFSKTAIPNLSLETYYDVNWAIDVGFEWEELQHCVADQFGMIGWVVLMINCDITLIIVHVFERTKTLVYIWKVMLLSKNPRRENIIVLIVILPKLHAYIRVCTVITIADELSVHFLVPIETACHVN